MIDIRRTEIYKNELQARVDTQLEWIYDNDGNVIGKTTKKVDKWRNVNKDMTTGKTENISIRGGKVNNLIIIDLDKPKEGELSGIDFFESHFGKIEDLNTLITKTPGGGFHIYYKYTNKLKDGVRLKYLNNKYSIDIRSDGGIAYEGLNYNVLSSVNSISNLLDIPDKFINFYNSGKEIEKCEKCYSTECYYTDEGIKLILNNLKSEYYNDYQEWLFSLISLKNIGCDIEIAKEFSMKSNKYNDNDFYKQWRVLKKREVPSIGSLLYFLKQSVSIDNYTEILKKLKKMKKKGGNKTLTTFKAVELFRELRGDYIKTDIDGVVYICNPKNKIWYKTKKSDKVLYDSIKDFNKYLIDNEYEYDLDDRNIKCDFYKDIIIELQETNIEELFNKNPFLLSFKCGTIIDLMTGIKRKCEYEDMIYNHTGYEYKTFDGGVFAKEFIKQQFPNEEETQCIINIFSLCLLGINPNEYIYSLIGKTAQNGKSTDCELLKSVIGKFGYRFPTNYLTATRESPEQANPVVMNFQEKRMAYCSEPDINKKININNIKEITGDEITARTLYSDKQVEFKPYATIFICSQEALDLERVDEGIKRRIITIPFQYSFVDEPKTPFQKKRIDLSIEDKINLKYSMLELLVSNCVKMYNDDKNFKFKIPKRFQDFKDDYLDEMDELTNYIIENYELCESNKILTSQINTDIKMTFKNTSLQEIKHKINNIFNIEPTRIKGKRYFIGIKHKEYNENETEF